MTWLDGFEQKAASTAGGTFDGSPWRLVLHTTEGGSIEGAIAAFAATGSWPHFTVDARADRKVQHYPLSTSARALAHPKGSPETNRAGAIQIEIVGFAADTPAWGPDELEWLGREVLAPIRAARSFPLTFPSFVGPEAGTIASARAPQRLTWDDWAAFSGICGHQHVPGNDHWDPGRLDVARIVIAAMDPTHQPPPVQEDDEMPKQSVFNPPAGHKDAGTYVLGAHGYHDAVRVLDPGHLTRLTEILGPSIELEAAIWDQLVIVEPSGHK